MIEIKPRNVIITGGTDGIGFILAQKYASLGIPVLVTGRKFMADPEAHFNSSHIRYVRADQVEPRKSAIRILRAVEDLSWTSCDLLILNAGTGWTGDPVDELANQIDEQIAVNLRAPIQICRTLAPHVLLAQGHVAFIGSTAHKGAPNFATYAATKAGIRGLVRSLREEWQGRATVQLIHPGPVRTSMHQKAGLKLGAVRFMFTHPKRAANAIMAAIVRGDDEVTVSHMASLKRGWRIPKGLRK